MYYLLELDMSGECYFWKDVIIESESKFIIRDYAKYQYCSKADTIFNFYGSIDHFKKEEAISLINKFIVNKRISKLNKVK